MILIIFIFIGILNVSNAFEYTDAALADQITSLPGLSDTLDFNHFSGYLDIAGNNGNSKHMHYWLVESQLNPANDPLTFWTNGGPGCSGLIGFMTEQGPFRPNEDGTVSLNSYAWNKYSNMVFIESPAGVGFSYTSTILDYTTGDTQTAIDNYNLIQEFLLRFPHFNESDLYITSESYGGHYMPTLAKQIVDANTEGLNPYLNFKGFAVGNPYTNTYSGTGASLDTFWGKQLVSKPTFDNYKSQCYGSKVSPKLCFEALLKVNVAIGDLNPYALDYPVCVDDSDSSKPNHAKKGRAQRTWLLNHMHSKLSKQERQALGVTATDEYVPCEDNYMYTYLNRADVKDAIHVPQSIIWEECSSVVDYSSDDGDTNTAPIYQYLLNGNFGLNILVYSGDDDSVCATIGTQDWIWRLGYSYVTPQFWTPYIVNEQTAGFLTKFSNANLAFLTVHNAGHEVPTYQPEVAQVMFLQYLNGEFF